jgi:hypothetical protein
MEKMNKQLKQLAKLFYGQTGIPNDPEHRNRIYGIVPRDHDHGSPIGHDDVSALANDLKPSPLERLDGFEVVHTRHLPHRQDAMTST